MKDYTFHFEHFKTLESMLEIIEKRPRNIVFETAKKSDSDDRGSSAEKFTETSSYRETVQLISKGYKDPLTQLKEGIAKSQRMTNVERKRPMNSLVGYKANVPNYIAGHPLSMVNRVNTAEKKKMIHLTYGFTAVGKTKTADLIKGGILFLSLVNQLELEGYRVKIDVLFCSVENNTAVGYTVNVKEYGHTMNLLKLCYPLVHPSMLRRTSFKWLETFEQLKHKKNNGFAYGYGSPLVCVMNMDGKKELEVLRKNGAIAKDAYYCNAYQCFRDCQTVDELKNVMGLK